MTPSAGYAIKSPCRSAAGRAAGGSRGTGRGCDRGTLLVDGPQPVLGGFRQLVTRARRSDARHAIGPVAITTSPSRPCRAGRRRTGFAGDPDPAAPRPPGHRPCSERPGRAERAPWTGRLCRRPDAARAVRTDALRVPGDALHLRADPGTWFAGKDAPWARRGLSGLASPCARGLGPEPGAWAGSRTRPEGLDGSVPEARALSVAGRRPRQARTDTQPSRRGATRRARHERIARRHPRNARAAVRCTSSGPSRCPPGRPITAWVAADGIGSRFLWRSDLVGPSAPH